MDRLVPIDADDRPPSRVGRTTTPLPGLRDAEAVQEPLPLVPPPEPHPAPTGPSMLCPQCVLSLVPLADGQGYVCPACRYSVAGEEDYVTASGDGPASGRRSPVHGLGHRIVS